VPLPFFLVEAIESQVSKIRARRFGKCKPPGEFIPKGQVPNTSELGSWCAGATSRFET
jgi:hypothetical protein